MVSALDCESCFKFICHLNHNHIGINHKRERLRADRTRFAVFQFTVCSVCVCVPATPTAWLIQDGKNNEKKCINKSIYLKYLHRSEIYRFCAAIWACLRLSPCCSAEHIRSTTCDHLQLQFQLHTLIWGQREMHVATEAITLNFQSQRNSIQRRREKLKPHENISALRSHSLDLNMISINRLKCFLAQRREYTILSVVWCNNSHRHMYSIVLHSQSALNRAHQTQSTKTAQTTSKWLLLIVFNVKRQSLLNSRF